MGAIGAQPLVPGRAPVRGGATIGPGVPPADLGADVPAFAPLEPTEITRPGAGNSGTGPGMPPGAVGTPVVGSSHGGGAGEPLGAAPPLRTGGPPPGMGGVKIGG